MMENSYKNEENLREKVVISPEATPFESFIGNVVRNGKPEEAVTVYKSRNHIYRVKVDDGVEINIKDFKLPNIVNRYVYVTLRESKAARSYHNALKLKQLGFSTPTPLGYGEIIKGKQLTNSYYFTLQVNDVMELRHIERHYDWRELLYALGEEMARLHKAGIWMKDFSPGNVLFKRVKGNHYEFSYVDLNRIEFNCRSRRKLMRMFGAMVYVPAHVMVMAEGYAHAMGMKSNEVAREALGAMNRWESRNKRKKFIKRLLGKKVNKKKS